MKHRLENLGTKLEFGTKEPNPSQMEPFYKKFFWAKTKSERIE